MPAADHPRCALLIIDMINLFDFPGGRALAAAADRASRVVERVRARFHAAGSPVVYVNDNFADWRADFHALVETCSHPQAPGAHRSSPRS